MPKFKYRTQDGDRMPRDVQVCYHKNTGYFATYFRGLAGA
jgi:hypothetical protein